ncbi:hypothetical protein SISSUDRAFT_1061835 [Sistotremastrum suecicum HHB10207 ss-3]|uniref:Uncharacterized protein n=1 Tax=Sistotremastrum suecicum HHB10207 ss-3 TaxID=1314776 RepID=A0A166DIZ8_9AGAM|nr:hypothetical protein SISSUDRAFT_1061835 [Sistotremastrum suecicum HHB10207 ss-3]
MANSLRTSGALKHARNVPSLPRLSPTNSSASMSMQTISPQESSSSNRFEIFDASPRQQISPYSRSIPWPPLSPSSSSSPTYSTPHSHLHPRSHSQSRSTPITSPALLYSGPSWSREPSELSADETQRLMSEVPRSVATAAGNSILFSGPSRPGPPPPRPRPSPTATHRSSQKTIISQKPSQSGSFLGLGAFLDAVTTRFESGLEEEELGETPVPA